MQALGVWGKHGGNFVPFCQTSSQQSEVFTIIKDPETEQVDMFEKLEPVNVWHVEIIYWLLINCWSSFCQHLIYQLTKFLSSEAKTPHIRCFVLLCNCNSKCAWNVVFAERWKRCCVEHRYSSSSLCNEEEHHCSEDKGLRVSWASGDDSLSGILWTFLINVRGQGWQNKNFFTHSKTTRPVFMWRVIFKKMSV